MHTIVATMAALLGFASFAPALAQPIERPTDCTEAMAGATIFIGHDCGEWASVMIVGTIVIRKPWNRANHANRGVRLRLRREGAAAVVAAPTATAVPTDWGIDISRGDPAKLDCEDFNTQAEAQAFFDAQGWSATNDPEGLDASRRDDDGIPCEHLP